MWGGDPEHEHEWARKRWYVNGGGSTGVAGGAFSEPGAANAQRIKDGRSREASSCACGAWRGNLGLESTPELYVAHIVEVFREVRRVLRTDGTVWLNLGDSYATGAGKVGQAPGGGEQGERWVGHGAHIVGPMTQPNRMPLPGLKSKDLIMMPARVALALQADGAASPGTMAAVDSVKAALLTDFDTWEEVPDRTRGVIAALDREWRDAQQGGWWLRSDIIWAKPNPMPESVTDRPTTAHEHLFLLTKAPRYYYDAEAIREFTEYPVGTGVGFRSKGREDAGRPKRVKSKAPDGWDTGPGAHATIHRNGRESGAPSDIRSGRNKRSVWTIATQPSEWDMCEACGFVYTASQRRRLPPVEYRELNVETEEWEAKTAKRCRKCHSHESWMSHYASVPEALVEPCILTGTSERGVCAECGAPWERVIKRTAQVDASAKGSRFDTGKTGAVNSNGRAQSGERKVKESTGWRPTCDHEAETVPATVLDPFVGSGTVGAVAQRLGRRAVGVDLSRVYLELAAKRLGAVALPMSGMV